MKLTEMTVHDYLELVASDAPAPGGGSASALVGAQGVGLFTMVAGLTLGRKKYVDFVDNCNEIIEAGKPIVAELTAQIDRDTDAYNMISAAFKMPKETDEEKAARSAAIQNGLKACTKTPMEMMELCGEAAALAASLLERGFNDTSASDLGVAFLSLKSGLQGAWRNVLINIGSLRDRAFAEECRKRGEILLDRALPLADAGFAKVVAMIEGE